MTRPRAPEATLDHLVVAAATLADGIEYVAEIAGVTPQPGGKHVAMGTHNALVRLSEGTFLEIIAIDPEGTKPSRPRWFDLDNIALQAELTERPRLIHWVARTTDVERAAAAVDGVRAHSVVAVRVHPDRPDEYFAVVVESDVVGNEDAEQILTSAVTEAVIADVDAKPRAVIVTAPGSLPKTTSGKRRRSAVAALFADHIDRLAGA